MDIPAFKQARRRADVVHLSGDGNIAADAASRSQRERLLALAQHLRVHLIELPVPSVCVDFYASVLQWATLRNLPVRVSRRWLPQQPLPMPPCAIRHLTEHELMIGRAERHGEDGDGPSALERLRATASPSRALSPAARPASASAALLARLKTPQSSISKAGVRDALGSTNKPTSLSQPSSTPRMPASSAAGILLPAPARLRASVASPSRRENHARIAQSRRAAELMAPSSSNEQHAQLADGLHRVQQINGRLGCSRSHSCERQPCLGSVGLFLCLLRNGPNHFAHCRFSATGPHDSTPLALCTLGLPSPSWTRTARC